MTKRLFVGLGSPHGDDQIGWRIAEGLAALKHAGDEVRTAASPADVFGWLKDVNRLIVVDACQSGGTPGCVRRWSWPAAIETCRGRSSHNLELADVLSIAGELEQLPRCVEVIGIEIARCEPGAPLSPALGTALPGLVASLWAEWNHA